MKVEGGTLTGGACADLSHVTRRRFVEGVAAGSALLGMGLPLRLRAELEQRSVLRGSELDLVIAEAAVDITGRVGTGTLVNGILPGPTIRFREGDDVTIRVTNQLSESTSIHWHGLLLPADMDGVPGLSFAGIAPGETFTYRFPIVQSGTYWYHSHSGTQEQLGLYGALILEPRAAEPYRYDRDYVIVLSDWTDEDPIQIVSNLKQQAEYYNLQQRTAGTFLDDVRERGFGATLADRWMWGQMRMTPTDIMDVTGFTYTFLLNGRPPASSWTGSFDPGQRVRLRIINAAAMTTFDVRIPGLGLQLVQADGNDVEPVDVEEIRIGVAETYDVIVEPRDQAYAIFAQAMDRSGYACGTLAPRSGMQAEIPPLDPPPLRTMRDMGMPHEGHGGGTHQGHGGMDHGSMGHGGAMQDMRPMEMTDSELDPEHASRTSHDSHESSHSAPPPPDVEPPAVNADGVDPASLRGQPFVDGVAMVPRDRLAEPGTGLENNGRAVLTYAQLRARRPAATSRPVERSIEFHLTGNMHRWTWGFDGLKFSEARAIQVKHGERIRFVLTNDTMMEHPIHLHGFLFELENGQEGRLPLKHTVNVKPGERLGFLYTAHTRGHWAFHCHLLYHMETGMFRTVVVS